MPTVKKRHSTRQGIEVRCADDVERSWRGEFAVNKQVRFHLDDGTFIEVSFDGDSLRLYKVAPGIAPISVLPVVSNVIQVK